MESLKEMNTHEIKDKLQDALNAYKDQFEEDLNPEKKEEFSKLFKVSVDDNNLICIDGIKLDFEVPKKINYICYEVEPQLINMYINNNMVMGIDFKYEYGQPLPEIKKVYLSRKLYSVE